jgi:ubiquitin-like 1-activating enzyme E1 B
MVGAGGIGCELLKTLVLSGFENIEMIDLDTIDVSNLNRQFLFRRKHVGQSKALVARESALKFRPGGEKTITAHHGNVKDETFDHQFVKRFDVVLNGLDNLEARKHVNRLCLAAETPLVESGTTGYLGQVTVHEGKGVNACFECSPKPTPKSHPICTLRDTPEKPVHCVAYATDLLFPRLFAARKDGTSDLDEEDAVEARAFSVDDARGESFAAFAARLFDFVFRAKIESLLEKEEMWEKRTKPQPLPAFRDLVDGESADAVAAAGDATLRAATASDAVFGGAAFFDAQRAMTVPQAARVFVSSVARIMTRDRDAALEKDPSGAGPCGTDAFDKDDALAVDFVAAVATLRSANYHIAPQSPFDVKGVAGNIVHAVATTNAIVGGLIVLEAIKILRKSKRKDANTQNDEGAPAATRINNRYTFVKKRATNNRLLEPVTPDPPNASCAVCGQARLELVCDTESFTLQRLLLDALTKKLGMHAPEINAPETVLYEQPDGLEEDEKAQYEKNLRAVLTALPAGGVRHGAVLSISDFSQKFEFELLVTHRPKSEWDEEEDPDLFILRGDASAIGGAGGGDGAEGAEAGGDAGTAVDDDDDFEIVDDGSPEVEVVEAADAGAKRKRVERDEDAGGAEKARRVE